MIYDLIIIGMGPAGISAGIYAKRDGLNVLVLESGMPGGLVNFTSEVDNYPGVSKKYGPDLAMDMFNHFKNVGVPFKNKRVLNIVDNKETKKVITKDEEFETRKILIASGRKPRRLGLQKEEDLIGKGISYCAICDAPLYKGKTVAVVGAGNSALEEANYLAEIVDKVYLIHRNDALGGDEVLRDRVLNNEKIEIIYNSKITDLNTNDKGILESISINDDNKIEVSSLFIYVGYEPSIDFINGCLETNASGHIVVDENYETTCKGIYAAGDIIAKKYYQIVLATSEGATASLNIARAIRNENGK